MKTAILLKFLQSCDAKATPNFPKTRSRKGDNGYTLLELLVVVIMLGILASIAAPGWLGFINRQRVRTVNDRVFQSLRLAQSEAKRTKSPVTITFDTSVAPKVTFIPALPTGGSEQKLDGGGEIKPGTITLLTNAITSGDPDIPLNSIIFDYQGNVKKFPPIGRFVVSVSASPNGAKQCAIVETLIGGMRTAEGNDPVNGCP
ncbi:MAG: prepilin-type N-terminal cleavage/methylation domain-containing protein [Microcoleus sp. PH2017_39_LGB_O_B]|jgi:prepilin-type N-terminal cleavage/methylation domain-containing protein|uniref:prepilin-type N-terminal cleavage/methylation domain-containing protein n=1 Tax=unclassified Microcoleus TaxID=2642155 RepID=UPI001E07A305|nr:MULTISPECIES: prepilin-type N-terminal cleavage/methylation domain-containing protein [unclassified Microcoleus]MCC3451408.1 prepilin-type N-terminal cleavage/methylation domain-containing protein [Microcoleus sp. PH2017_09_SFU_O_A]MCC3632316.1 prepilin-type N-terminal cleavage/methylation domain-containing protein [Microcoleus sp. PH2017_39_LGB_O_B]MCC3644559.1 prepilin-type N-terminal cleavage/methylation domain-containing protein [Microcoleus sp. PH2017_33_LGB_O_A]TAF86731.1 MAG: prepilin